ncbi:antibiotic biosynthesis monooxygenase [Lacicoccus alkaliphilus]|uniref:Heme oxygenase (Staphylobilin-producing) n=1 Tax=Lacicoccus alkaliphilus DSM 16010 TaxID=1123231 RepID=A0A1M7AG19_9BACL|nr:antibiotic biosynthesis monooxygenase [Salinicoccus alkaliphilus]SHL41604.1 heme oxygenase (staphylobilin-producing) [Salinicoccus alkaliphilus DSM 16010]
MIKVVNALSIKKGRIDEVAVRFQEPKTVHTFEGFELMEVLRNEKPEDHDELLIATTWKDHASFEAWRDSRKNEKAHNPKPSGDKPADNPIIDNEIRIYDIAHRHLPE